MKLRNLMKHRNLMLAVVLATFGTTAAFARPAPRRPDPRRAYPAPRLGVALKPLGIRSYSITGSMNNKAGVTIQQRYQNDDRSGRVKLGPARTVVTRSGNLRLSRTGNILAKIKGFAGRTDALAVYNPATGKTVIKVGGQRVKTTLRSQMEGEALFKSLVKQVPTRTLSRASGPLLRANFGRDLVWSRGQRFSMSGSLNDKAGIQVVQSTRPSPFAASKRAGIQVVQSTRPSPFAASKTVRTGNLWVSKTGNIRAKIQDGTTKALAVYNPSTGKTAYTIDGVKHKTTLPTRMANKRLFKQLSDLLPMSPAARLKFALPR